MELFIAYFDYLGFTAFIENNDLEAQKKTILHNLRDIEMALGKGKTEKTARGVISDISNVKINCINFSDTVVFFSKDNNTESLIEILEIATTFNRQAINYFFPVRGAIVYGDLAFFGYNKENQKGSVYNINSIFGKGLIKAYLKANAQNWAGSVIDESVLIELKRRGIDEEMFLNPYAKKYNVPTKTGIAVNEFALNLTEGSLNNESLKNFEEGIRRNFSAYNKSISDISVQKKLNNTILFLKSYLQEEK